MAHHAQSRPSDRRSAFGRWTQTRNRGGSSPVTRMVNFREGCCAGTSGRGGFASIRDRQALFAHGTPRYVELNPVRAGLIKAPSRYKWSSAAAHVRGKDDALVRVAPLIKLAPDWRGFLARAIREEDIKQSQQRAGRDRTDPRFLAPSRR